MGLVVEHNTNILTSEHLAMTDLPLLEFRQRVPDEAAHPDLAQG